MRVLLVSMGSAGDLLPFIALGRALRARGHDVTVLSNGYFRDVAENAALRFVEVCSADDHVKRTRQRSCWGLWRSFTEGGRNLLDDMSRVFETVAAHYVPGETVVAATGLMFGARIAQEKLGLPLATVHLSPLCFRGVHDDMSWPRWMPLPVRRVIFGMLERGIDRLFGGAINRFRSQLGLPPAVRILSGWWHSPQMVLGLFPDWLCPPQPDWPANTVLTGPPLYDTWRPFTQHRELEAFLSGGEPPLVFSQSTAAETSSRFFADSVAVAQSLGCRAVLLASQGEQIPRPLPDGIRHFPYVPHSLLLPRACALVHHGGIGTALQALAAGIAQLIVPVFLDQPDNGRRLERLGVAATVRPASYRVHEVCHKLKYLLDSPDVAMRCREYAARCRETKGLDRACMALEQLFTDSGGTTALPAAVYRLPALAKG
jgi:rhamnosyltransferase subunit B